MHKLFRAAGFSLVELMIVVAIMSVLAALAIVSNAAYRRNVENAKTASTVSAYQNAASSAIFGEYPIIPDGYTEPFAKLHSCISTTDPSAVCCFLYYVAADGNLQYGCNNNTAFNPFTARFGAGPSSVGFPVGYTASQLSSRVRGYMPTTPPALPYDSSVPDCAGAITLYGGALPCAARQVGLQIDTASDYSSQAYLHYMLPVDKDCQSKNVVTPTPTQTGLQTMSGGNFYYPIGVSYANATYSARNTVGTGKYTFCVVAIK